MWLVEYVCPSYVEPVAYFVEWQYAYAYTLEMNLHASKFERFILTETNKTPQY